ncbi:MAG: hypothetical protein J0653_07000 [Deltaproteobacteria bacterium]|nr:hypothetical protein [Deltaproteobacteria bacterium]
MGSNLFVTASPVPPERWRQAFPGAVIARSIPSGVAPETLLWLHNETPSSFRSTAHAGALFITLHDEPSDEKGLIALSEGAVGYANAHASPQLLHTIESVVRNQGGGISAQSVDTSDQYGCNLS